MHGQPFTIKVLHDVIVCKNSLELISYELRKCIISKSLHACMHINHFGRAAS